MPSYEYVARDRLNNKHSGTILASNLKSAASSLASKGMVPIKIVAQRQSVGDVSEILQNLFSSRLLFLSIFTSSFGRLLKSGLTMPQAMAILAKQFKRSFISKRLSRINEKLRLGTKLSECLGEFPELFPGYLVALCRAGENSGCLADVFVKASDFFARLRKLKNKISSALIYPAFLGMLAFITVILLFAFILPRISFVYQEFQADLPWQTQLLLSLGDFIANYYYGFLIIAVLFIIGFLYLRLGQKGHHFGNRFRYHIPILGKILIRAELADQLSVTGILIDNGVSLPAAIRVTRSLTEFTKQEQEFERIASHIEAGKSLSFSIKDTKIIPDYAKDIISLGEEADCLPESLENSSDIIKSEVEQKLVMLTSLFEPFMVLAIALVIGFIMFSILLPIFNLDFLAQ